MPEKKSNSKKKSNQNKKGAQPTIQPAPQLAPQMDPNMMAAMGGFMQMMQNMQVQVDPAAIPFKTPNLQQDDDKGLDADFIDPSTLENTIKTQEIIPTGTVLDKLCLTDDFTKSLGGIPKGCTIAFAGPPGSGKTRSILTTCCRIAASGMKVGLIVAEEIFYDPNNSGRDDLCSRMKKAGMKATGLKEKEFDKKVFSNIVVLEAQYHKGIKWDEFVSKYRYMVEQEEIDFIVIDSLNTLDPTKTKTADNLSALKTYNHEHGVTCLVVSQIKDTGGPVGGASLEHVADVVFVIDNLYLSSKNMAEQWGAAYKDNINVIKVTKSVTTPIFSHLIRVDLTSGELQVHDDQPSAFAVI